MEPADVATWAVATLRLFCGGGPTGVVVPAGVEGASGIAIAFAAALRLSVTCAIGPELRVAAAGT